MRKLQGIVRWLFIGLTLAVILLVMANVFFPEYVVQLTQVNIGYYAYIFSILMPLVFILHAPTKVGSKKAVPWYDILLAILAFGSFFFAGLFALKAQDAGWSMVPPLYVGVIAIIACGLSIEAGRRTGGTAFAAMVFIFGFVPYVVPFLPPPFTGPTPTLLRVPAFYLLASDGIFGPATAAFCDFVVGYLIFGAVIQFTGGGEYLIKIALTVVGGLRGATAKVSIVASALFGMLSGSAMSNVLTVGTVTIPAMKKSGYPPYYAGAIEACSSTGGIVMPPVMGAVAFVMAQFTLIPYAQIALAAFIPGLIYFMALYIQSDFQAIKIGIKAVPKEERMKFTPKLLLEGLDYFISAVVLALVIFWLQATSQAPFWALIPLLIGGVAKKKLNIRNAPDVIYGIGGLLIGMVALFACLGLITGSMLTSGIGISISSVMHRLGAGSTIWLVLLGAILALILGMGITVSAVYILVAILLCPALVQLGFNLMATHLFVVYYAAVASITPPVGLVSLAASQLAGAGYFKVGFQACRLGVVMLLMPLYFIHEPSLVLQGTALDTIRCFGIAVMAMMLLSAGFERYIYGLGKIAWPEAIAALVSGLIIILPLDPQATRIGWIVAALLVAYWIIRFAIRKLRPKGSTT